METLRKATEGFEARDIFLFMPVAGTAIAVTFDVGVFYGLDISYFTVFSISEHIGFALVYIPFALGVVAMLLPLIALWNREWWLVVAPRYIMNYEELPPERQYKLKARVARIARFASGCSFIAGVVMLYLLFGSKRGDVMLLVAGVAMAITGAIGLLQPLAISHKRFIITLYVAVTLGFAFAEGVQSARHIVDDKVPRNLIVLADEAVPGRLIRSGERGALYLNTITGELVLMPWSAIKSVRTVTSSGATSGPASALPK